MSSLVQATPGSVVVAPAAQVIPAMKSQAGVVVAGVKFTPQAEALPGGITPLTPSHAKQRKPFEGSAKLGQKEARSSVINYRKKMLIGGDKGDKMPLPAPFKPTRDSIIVAKERLAVGAGDDSEIDFTVTPLSTPRSSEIFVEVDSAVPTPRQSPRQSAIISPIAAAVSAEKA